MKNVCFFLFALSVVKAAIPESGLVLDLDAARGVVVERQKVVLWQNQVNGVKARDFVHRDEGRTEKKSGCPTWRPRAAALNGNPSIVFRQQELVCMEEDFFDSLSTGQGHTWVVIIAANAQRTGVKDVNSFFGNLCNGKRFDGIWGGLSDDNTVWWGVRNGITFGRFDGNNPQVLGPRLDLGRFYLIAGRMAAGTGIVKLELFVDDEKPTSSRDFPVNPMANPSRLAIGQERDAVEHPGHESFDGEIARFLIWNRPLSDAEWNSVRKELRQQYFPDAAHR